MKVGKPIKVIHQQPFKKHKYDPAAHLRFQTIVAGEW